MADSLEELLRDVPADKLDHLCTDDHLLELSQSLDYWPGVVSPFLKLTPADEAEIKHERDVRRQRFDVLRQWKTKQRDKATYQYEFTIHVPSLVPIRKLVSSQGHFSDCRAP